MNDTPTRCPEFDQFRGVTKKVSDHTVDANGMVPDTTTRCPQCGAGEDVDSPSSVNLYLCGSRFFSNGARSTTPLCDESYARQKAEDEVARWKGRYENSCDLVARMHEAAVGEIRGPIIGVVEDIKALREQAIKANSEVARLTQALVSCLHITNVYDGNYTRACDHVQTISSNALKEAANPKTK